MLLRRKKPQKIGTRGGPYRGCRSALTTSKDRSRRTWAVVVKPSCLPAYSVLYRAALSCSIRRRNMLHAAEHHSYYPRNFGELASRCTYEVARMDGRYRRGGSVGTSFCSSGSPNSNTCRSFGRPTDRPHACHASL